MMHQNPMDYLDELDEISRRLSTPLAGLLRASMRGPRSTCNQHVTTALDYAAKPTQLACPENEKSPS
jgi:hypothetical protein